MDSTRRPFERRTVHFSLPLLVLPILPVAVRAQEHLGTIRLGPDGLVTHLAFAPDGMTFAMVGGGDGFPETILHLIDTETRRPVGRLPWRGSAPLRLEFSTDGKSLVAFTEEGPALKKTQRNPTGRSRTTLTFFDVGSR